MISEEEEEASGHTAADTVKLNKIRAQTQCVSLINVPVQQCYTCRLMSPQGTS